VDPDSTTGQVYGAIARRAARRRSEIRDLLEAGLNAEEVAAVYGRDHPIERPVTPAEIRASTRTRAASGK
jgi:hypothetical protein